MKNFRIFLFWQVGELVSDDWEVLRFSDSEVVNEQIMSHSLGSVSYIHLSILISLLSVGLPLESQYWICEWIHVFNSCSVLVLKGISVFEGWGSEIEGLVFLCFYNAWANGIVRSEFDLYINVPSLRVVQEYEMWCCRFAVKLLSIHLALTSWCTFPISLVVICCDAISVSKWLQNHSCTTGSSRAELESNSTATTFVMCIIVASIASWIELIVLRGCIPSIRLSKSESLLTDLFAYMITKCDL